MSLQFTTKGICIFSPSLNRGGSIKRRDGKTTEWWMIIQCDRSIGDYYRSLHKVYSNHILSLSEPLWGTHVSIIRDEKPKQLGLWKSLEGKEVEISYSNQVNLYSGYAVLDVKCEELLDYREKLGLTRQPELPLAYDYRKS